MAKHDYWDSIMIYNGQVCSGQLRRSQSFVQNNGSEINKINEWLGVFIYAGSLNVKVDKKIKFKKLVYRDEFIALYRCRFIDMEAWAMRRSDNKDPMVIEILSQYNLRNKYKLKNGQPVTIEV